jgi:hypothetical protein
MAGSQTPEQVDAIYRARAETNLLLGKYSRRLKAKAEQLALTKMIADPSRDPDEVGREAFEQAGVECELIEADAKTARALSG